MVNESRLRIIEGIPGSGKDTLQRRMLTELRGESRPVYVFSEDALLFSWKHYRVPDIDVIRLGLMERLLAFVRAEMRDEPESIFIFNRFHISFALLNRSAGLEEQYERVVSTLRDLDAHVIVPVLGQDEMAARVRHLEREQQERVWRVFRERRAAESNICIEELYTIQQQRILALLQQQGIPYTLTYVAVEPAATAD